LISNRIYKESSSTLSILLIQTVL